MTNNDYSRKSNEPHFAAAFAELYQLSAHHWARVDQQDARPVSALYTANGVMLVGKVCARGRSEIDAYFVERFADAARIGRLTRHIASVPVIDFEENDRAIVLSTVTLFAGIGQLPLACRLPSAIADFRDECVREPDGRWRYLSRKCSVIFLGEGTLDHVR